MNDIGGQVSDGKKEKGREDERRRKEFGSGKLLERNQNLER